MADLRHCIHFADSRDHLAGGRTRGAKEADDVSLVRVDCRSEACRFAACCLSMEQHNSVVRENLRIGVDLAHSAHCCEHLGSQLVCDPVHILRHSQRNAEIGQRHGTSGELTDSDRAILLVNAKALQGETVARL
eukprot:3724443-Prymnesium_polylepis.1